MRPFDGPSRRLLAAGVGALVGLALLAGAYSLVFGVGSDPGACACRPPVTFAFDENPDGEGVVVTHEGGNSIAAGDLVVSVGGTRQTWAARANVSAASRIGTGDSLAVRARDGDVIRVVWLSGDGNRSTELGNHTVGG